MNVYDQIKRMARTAKREGYDRDKAERLAPNAKPEYFTTFMAEYDRFKPRNK